ncbi:MAG: proton-conducting transporter membrane subunit, partial [Clostridiales bacterium]|nr:proton-conducting transporter membrane subunit [Clostridiales bacterium]
KRLLAFCSVENIGIILIGLGICFVCIAQKKEEIASLALTAALFHTFNHALYKGGLFLGAGSIQYSTQTKDMEKLGGLMKRMPVTGFLVLCFSLAISAIIPFNGFLSEWMTFQSFFANIVPGQSALNILSIVSVAVLGLASAMAAACFVKLFGICFLGLPRSSEAKNAKEVPVTMNVGAGILAGLCLFTGLFPYSILKLIDTAAVSVIGNSILGQLRGGIMFVFFPLNIKASSVSPFTFFIALILVVILALLTIRVVGGKYIERKFGTWDCGFKELNSKMQYSAAGFSKPIKIVFKILFRSSNKVTSDGDSIYHPKSIKYESTLIPIFEKYLYRPFYEKMNALSKRTKYRVQTGSIHNYLIYILAALLILMTYNRFV